MCKKLLVFVLYLQSLLFICFLLQLISGIVFFGGGGYLYTFAYNGFAHLFQQVAREDEVGELLVV